MVPWAVLAVGLSFTAIGLSGVRHHLTREGRQIRRRREDAALRREPGEHRVSTRSAALYDYSRDAASHGNITMLGAGVALSAAAVALLLGVGGIGAD